MLTELYIRNLAVIEEVRISFHNGFHVLTGETGAGKSIVIDALGLVAGNRASADLVRYGSDKAEIEAAFDLTPGHPARDVCAKLGIGGEEGELLIIRREVSSTGKSTCRINGQLVNQSMLRQVGECLINIHGQHEPQSLMQPETHLHWLDEFAGEPVAKALAETEALFENYQKLLKERRELEQSSKQSLQMLDLYRFQAEEIDSASLKVGEDEALMEEKRKLGNAEKLSQSVNEAYEALYASNKGLTAINKAATRLAEAANYDPAPLKPILEQVQSAYYQLEDAAFQLRDYRDRIEFNPDRLAQIEERLDLIYTLRRKYGDTVQDILAHGARIKRELEMIENKDEVLAKLNRETEAAARKLAEAAERLSELRREAADKLARAIEKELQDLHMERTRFEVHLSRQKHPDGILAKDGIEYVCTKRGFDQAEFLISANPGEPLKPLSRIASGGEMSRIMLAMKSIFARLDRIPVLVFDEVDTGISGRAAQAVAEKMSTLAQDCQVFAITHLPQVACMADTQYEIRKNLQDGRTYTEVEELDWDGRVRELARMLGGVEVTETTSEHAQEMLAMAIRRKSAK
ncbi:DNA repair protein RecN [Paenibacillus thermoaerophilus]|uniref:DNA repair protein RecN n=1 Tax=Paenibacillus thermoaerophilus TaxID=1215385 RepID=A0ABW2V7S5_9BACL|nr:DNA repair protein RecN [Paenibacillus thermoaerophilus]TMV11990.1 DNA repair protein RecN [Paenibacillus thermoaerophilus]